MTKLPEQLQKKIEDKISSFSMSHDKNNNHNVFSQWSFEQGASAMHSLMLEELKTIVKALKKISNEDREIFEEDEGKDIYSLYDGYSWDDLVDIISFDQEEAKKALAHYREKIEGMK